MRGCWHFKNTKTGDAAARLGAFQPVLLVVVLRGGHWAANYPGRRVALVYKTKHCDRFLPSLWAGTCLPAAAPRDTHSLPAACCAAYTPTPLGPHLWYPHRWPKHILSHTVSSAPNYVHFFFFPCIDNAYPNFLFFFFTKFLLLTRYFWRLLKAWRRRQLLRTSSMRSPDCRRPSLTAAPRGKMFLTRMGPGPWTEESLVTTVKPRPSEPRHTCTGRENTESDEVTLRGFLQHTYIAAV